MKIAHDPENVILGIIWFGAAVGLTALVLFGPELANLMMAGL